MLDRRQRLRIKRTPLPAPTPVWDPYTQQLVIKTYKEDRLRVVEYFVKWRGLGYTSATWEDEAWVLENARAQVGSFRQGNGMPPLESIPDNIVLHHNARRQHGDQECPTLKPEGTWGNYLCGNENVMAHEHVSSPTETSTEISATRLVRSASPLCAWGAYLTRGDVWKRGSSQVKPGNLVRVESPQHQCGRKDGVQRLVASPNCVDPKRNS